MFHSTIEKIETREKFPDFQPNLSIESNTQERIRVLEQVDFVSYVIFQLNLLCKLVRHNRLIRIMKVWHGTTPDIAYKIAQIGFANMGKTDSGWFGKGT